MEKLVNKDHIVKVYYNDTAFIPKFEKSTYRKSFFGIKYGKEIEFFYCADDEYFINEYHECDTLIKAKELYLEILKRHWRYDSDKYRTDEDGIKIIKGPWIKLTFSDESSLINTFDDSESLFKFLNEEVPFFSSNNYFKCI